MGAGLRPLTDAYAEWLDKQKNRAAILSDLDSYQEAASTALANGKQTLARIQAGIDLLDSDPQAAQAFRFANRAMQQQRIRSIYAGQVRQGQEPDLEAIDQPKNRSWRPFQLAFVLLNLPRLANPTHPDRSDGSSALAAYEMEFCLNWDPAETTLISLDTGRSPHTLQTGDADKLWAWNWLEPVLDAFTHSASDQQVHLVQTFFEQLDFRRFQVDLREPISMDEAKKIPELVAYGKELGRKILHDETDGAQQTQASQAPHPL